jgi:hypothetical protein
LRPDDDPNFDGRRSVRWGYDTNEIVEAFADMIRKVSPDEPAVTLILHDESSSGTSSRGAQAKHCLGRPGIGTLKVDGKEVATKEMKRTLPMILQWDESFDIGSDTLTGVNDADYTPPFALTVELYKLTLEGGPATVVPRRHQEARGGAAQQQGQRMDIVSSCGCEYGGM